MERTIKLLTILGIVSLALFVKAEHASAQRPDNSMRGDVTVQNNRNVPATVYVEQGPFDVRIGEVGALSMTTLALPTRMLEEGSNLHFFVRPKGERELSAEAFVVQPGVHLGLLVPEVGHRFVPEPDHPQMVAPLSPLEQEETTVTVDNPRNVAVTVYVERGPFDLRLGAVAANQERTFPLPEWLVRERDQVDFVLHPDHGVDLSSEVLVLRHGAHLGIAVPRSKSG